MADGITPTIKPIDTYEGVFQWEGGRDALSVCKISRSSLAAKTTLPKTLLCHDMKGGYLEDRFVQGSNSSDAYRFYHWQYIDIFVYFSHNLVTIPPPCWTNAGHRNGVQVLGTLITEWKYGFTCCDVFLENSEVYQRFADKLIDIAEYYGFDGWLINIENVVEPWKVNDLKGFLEYLTVTIHERIPSSVVIWYDSVVDTGHLDWQNELNDKNRLYFDVCDGIYLNYNWDNHMLEISKSRAVEAGRPFDVYAGIDVFGRGTPGGGGYNTREALNMVRQNNLSVALFAPGWVYETQGKDNFTYNENRFWWDLHDLCPSNRRNSLPLVTSFCQGFGDHYYLEGVEMLSTPWSNLSLQQIQPLLPLNLPSVSSGDTRIHTEFSNNTVYQGGGSLFIRGEVSPSITPHLISLFSTEITISTGLNITLVMKTIHTSVDEVGLLLEFQENTTQKKIYLTPDFSSGNTEQLVVTPSMIIDKNGWSSRMYAVPESMINNTVLNKISLILTPTESKQIQFYLGQIKIVSSDHEVVPIEIRDFRSVLISSDNNKYSYQLQWWTLQHTIIDHYNIYKLDDSEQFSLCGQATLDKYILEAEGSLANKTIAIQPVYYTGEVVNILNCSQFTMNIKSY